MTCLTRLEAMPPVTDPFALALAEYRQVFGDTPIIRGLESFRYGALAAILR
ncbi:hypothetical protein [Siccirubricoccus sp. G192]|uniref:hypothetical protein n=1 Tax=Siccirubricoccus sp. G192 TaxID=2849651 RepID=UPI001C2BA728|nr:hypothetical protein [Siccirubricoccus sp. G192]MBV1800311.1 hypothetical protein [Siccirubricoccus sp. G192]